MDSFDGCLHVPGGRTCIELMEGASGHQEVVTELLNAGADPKTTNEKEQTPLYVLARPG
jgi:ankyrin repeat protein